MQFRNIILTILGLLCGALNGYSQLLEIEEFGENPGDLGMNIYVPESVKSLQYASLLVALHGCSQNVNDMLEVAGWRKLADENQFILLLPEQKVKNNVSKCFNWYKQKDYKGDRGEAASIMRMIAYTVDNFPVAEDQISIYGVSAGAAISVALMIENPCVFKGGAILGGGPYAQPTSGLEGMALMDGKDVREKEEWCEGLSWSTHSCRPKLVVMHGSEDNVVHPTNRTELIKQWECLSDYDSLVIHKANDGNSSIEVRKTSYTYLDKEVIVSYELIGIGHKLAIDPGSECNRGGKDDFLSKDVDFFSSYNLAKDLGLIRNDRCL